MVYLIYGEDTFRSKEKLAAIKEKYRTSCGETNLVELDGESLNWQNLQNQISAAPFLANKRLVIIKFVSKSTTELREKLADYLDKVPVSTVVFFYEEKLDLRLAIFKKLLLVKKNCEQFSLLDEVRLKRWAEKRVEALGLKIDRSALNLLTEITGPNLWRLNNEIIKLANYKFGQTKSSTQPAGQINISDTELLVTELTQANVFSLIDALHEQKLAKSLEVLQILTNAGEDQLRLLGLIVSQFRNLLIVADARSKNNHVTSYELSRTAGLKPFVATKLLSQARQLDESWIKKSYEKLADFDWQIKIGYLEPQLGLNLLTLSLCGNFNTR